MRKIMIDLNVVLDVIQKREPHYHASAKVLAQAHKREFEGVVPSHALTTIHYIIAKYKDIQTAGKTVDCKMIVTRNVVDFTNSPLPALTPEEFLTDDLFAGD